MLPLIAPNFAVTLVVPTEMLDARPTALIVAIDALPLDQVTLLETSSVLPSVNLPVAINFSKPFGDVRIYRGNFD